MSTKASGLTAKEDLINALDRLVNISGDSSQISKPNPLFALFYRQCYRTVITASTPKNFIIINDPDQTLDFESATAHARQLFEQMCPGEDFLPPSTDPDETEEFDVN